jgi:hypothetical protein
VPVRDVTRTSIRSLDEFDELAGLVDDWHHGSVNCTPYVNITFAGLRQFDLDHNRVPVQLSMPVTDISDKFKTRFLHVHTEPDMPVALAARVRSQLRLFMPPPAHPPARPTAEPAGPSTLFGDPRAHIPSRALSSSVTCALTQNASAVHCHIS